MLKSWDALHQKERDGKHCFLQQRVKLQHDLIAKADQLAEEKRTKAVNEQQKVSGHPVLLIKITSLSDWALIQVIILQRIQSRKMSHKEMVDALRAHMQKGEVNQFLTVIY